MALTGHGVNYLCHDEDSEAVYSYTKKEKPRPFGRGFVLALPIFPGRHQPSIVGVNELNFCVRDGNRWTLITINTNSFRIHPEN